MAEEALFISVAETGRGIIYGCFFLLFFFVSCRKDKMRAWLGTATAGQKGQTRGPASARETEVRQEAKDAASCFFTDLWRLNGGQAEGSTVEGILGEGTSTRATGCFVCVVIWRLQQPHRGGGRKHVVREEEQAHTGGAVVAFQFWRCGTVASRQQVVSYWYFKSRLNGWHNTGTLTTSSHRGNGLNTLCWHRWPRRCWRCHTLRRFGMTGINMYEWIMATYEYNMDPFLLN